MAKDRARDDRRSVGSHEKMTAALGRATGTTRLSDAKGVIHTKMNIKENPKNWQTSVGRSFDAPGKGHVTVGEKGHEYYSQDETFTARQLDNKNNHVGVHGTAGISGEHKNKKGGPSNIGMDEGYKVEDR